MNSEIRTCKNTGKSKYCMGDFEITPDDFTFYKKMQVPAPTFCPECRLQRKLCWRNERVLYSRHCDKTKELIVSTYASNSRFPVYSMTYWWSDKWDFREYGIDIDFSKSFFDQFLNLQNNVPRLALVNTNSINSDYSLQSANSKDVYMCVGAFDSENCMHSNHMFSSKNCSDVYRAEGKSNEYLYECINVHDCFNCQFCYLTTNCFDCYYSFDLRNCSNCFLSYNLRNQSYCFMNQKYSKKEYTEKINEFNLKSYKEREYLYQEWIKIIFEKAYHKNKYNEFCNNSSGNFLFHTNNAQNCFDSENVESCRYLQLTSNVKDSYDLYAGGLGSSLIYDSLAIAQNNYNIKFSFMCRNSSNLEYCDSCYNSTDLFGCVGVKNGAYMIFNKQYSREEYLKLKKELIEHMINIGEYGHFFPKNLSPFSYNETQAQTYLPLTKEEAVHEGFGWNDSLPGTYQIGNIDMNQLADSIDNMNLSLSDTIFTCLKSGRNYNLTKQEYDFFKTYNIPIPRLHPNERYKSRKSLRPIRKAFLSNCFLCNISIPVYYEVALRPQKIICEDCYKREVL